MIVSCDISGRIPAQRPDLIFVEIHPDVVGDELSHGRVAVARAWAPFCATDAWPHLFVGRIVEVRLAAVEILQIGSASCGKVSVVVVHHIHLHRHAPFMGLVDKILQRIRTSIRLLDGEKGGWIVAPAVPPVELAHRHERDHVHPQIAQVIELQRRVVKGRRLTVGWCGIIERPHMQLIHHDLVGKGRLVAVVIPNKCPRIIDHRRLRSIGKRAHLSRPWIFSPELSPGGCGDHIFISVPRPCACDRSAPDTRRRIFTQHIGQGIPSVEVPGHRDLQAIGHPDSKLDARCGMARLVHRGAQFLSAGGIPEDDHQEKAPPSRHAEKV